MPLNYTPLLENRALGKPGVAEGNIWLSFVSFQVHTEVH